MIMMISVLLLSKSLVTSSFFSSFFTSLWHSNHFRTFVLFLFSGEKNLFWQFLCQNLSDDLFFVLHISPLNHFHVSGKKHRKIKPCHNLQLAPMDQLTMLPLALTFRCGHDNLSLSLSLSLMHTRSCTLMPFACPLV